MRRSAESITRRRAYTAAWRAARPDYGRDWATAHPAIERSRRRRWKSANREKVRASEQRRRLVRTGPSEPIASLHTGHPLFDQARAIVGPNRHELAVWLDPLYDDLLSVAVVALIEGTDPAAAVRRFRASETTWRRVTGPLFDEWGIAA